MTIERLRCAIHLKDLYSIALLVCFRKRFEKILRTQECYHSPQFTMVYLKGILLTNDFEDERISSWQFLNKRLFKLMIDKDMKKIDLRILTDVWARSTCKMVSSMMF